MNLLLLSSSRVDDTGYLEHALPLIKDHIGERHRLLFIPYAGISVGFDAYLEMVNKALQSIGLNADSVHNMPDPVQAVREADTILVGGGNTFCLLNSLYEKNLIEAVRAKLNSGTPYIGWSAGSNIAAPTIRTTNDMPIIEPPSFNALNLVPFQINPHYIDGNPPGHNGETREQRISEFLEVNPNKVVVGIPEGTALLRNGDKLTYVAEKDGFIFTKQEGKQLISSNADLSYLLKA
ncbi:MAG: dipeptidase PepE [Kangiellaceae bacterium]|nr:dipeptidase PepE [Kangiellaceae bacterium]MCW8998888.1 dipeptidase PepE [Kangiellaceae bacterium]MCW9018297.1 dipeptidase PepE [Kangiellaceae bacterium]